MNTPYLSWTTSNMDLYEYSSSYSYEKDDLVTYMNSIYKSISDNNLGEEPINSPFWIRIL
jgi:hypothetical protein|nr:MAG TPA: hypothetical protein [Caudoviricetes sp.]